jgi:hypothetical protein
MDRNGFDRPECTCRETGNPLYRIRRKRNIPSIRSWKITINPPCPVHNAEWIASQPSVDEYRRVS